MYLVKSLLKTPHNPRNFNKLVVLAQTRLLLYNKRRTGELEVVRYVVSYANLYCISDPADYYLYRLWVFVKRLQSYASRNKGLDNFDESLAGELSAVEKKLLETQDLMKIRGKRGRTVPVIIPLDVRPTLAFLANGTERIVAGIDGRNPYLFPNSANSHARAYESLKSVCSDLELRAPHQITSVSMRKYTATLTQMLNLTRTEMDWVCQHLGYSKSVHKEHYRQMSGLLERTKISKMLLCRTSN